jgi:hypothetical protein
MLRLIDAPAVPTEARLFLQQTMFAQKIPKVREVY